MSLLKTLILGRDNGIRAKIRGALFGGKSGGAGSGSRASDPPPPAAEASMGLGIEPPKDVTPPDGYEVVLHRDALPEGKIIEVIIGGKAIAVANVSGEYHACANSCPHADGPLGEGTLEGSILTCPYHGWQFDLISGTCLTNGDATLPLYDVVVEQEAVCVKL